MTTTDTAPDVHAGPREQPPFVRLQILGLLLVALGPIMSMVGEVAALGSEGLLIVVFLGPITLLAVTAAGLAWRFGTWARIVGVVLGLLVLAMFGAFIVSNLRHLNSFLDFVPLVTTGVGAIFAIVFGLVAVAGRRGSASATAGVERRTAAVTLTVLTLLALASGITTIAGAQTVEAARSDGAIALEMAGYAFAPDTLTVASDDRLLIHNSDPVLHTFTVPALGIDQVVPPGSDALVELGGADTGSFTFYCKPHSDTAVADPDDAGMAATLTVE